MVELIRNSLMKSFSELPQPMSLVGQLFLAKCAGLAKTNDARNRQSAAAQAAFVTAAVQDGFEPNSGISATHVQRPDALGTIDFMSRHTEKVDPHLFHVERDFAHGLDGIGVEEDAPFFAKLADFPDRLERPNLVVGGHDAHQQSLVAKCVCNLIDRDASKRI